jgi:hypothetical protein
MASINASTSGAGGVITTADATGNLSLQSGGTTVVAVSSTGLAVTGNTAITGTLASSGKLSVDGINISPYAMKNKIIKTSLIFTKWGIWELKCNNKKEVEDIPKKEIRKQLDKIYFENEKGHEINNSIMLQNRIKNIEEILQNEGFDFNMYFTEWFEIDENDYELH